MTDSVFSVCEGANISIPISGSEIGVEYFLRSSETGQTISETTLGNGSSILINIPDTLPPFIRLELVGSTPTCNKELYEFTLTTKDTLAPVLDIPDSIQIYLDTLGSHLINLDSLQTHATDNCTMQSELIHKYNPRYLSCANLGGNDLLYTVSDLAGNTTTKAIFIEVLDTISPEFFVADTLFYLDDGGSFDLSAENLTIISERGCTSAKDFDIQFSKSSFTCADADSIHLIKAVFSSNQINVDSLEFFVNIKDSIAPTAELVSSLVYNLTNGMLALKSEDVLASFEDNCGIKSITLSPDSFSCNNPGEQDLRIDLVDDFGNLTRIDTSIFINGGHFLEQDSVEACKYYVWEITGDSLFESGIYYDSLVTKSGCDSVYQLHLEIINEAFYFENSVSFLTAYPSNASYQWFECGAELVVLEVETESTFTPEKGGFYTVAINLGGCTDTLECQEFIVTDIQSTGKHNFKFAPNPSKDNFYLITDQEIEPSQLQIFTVDGRVIKAVVSVENGAVKINLKNQAPGTYFLHFNLNHRKHTLKLVRE